MIFPYLMAAGCSSGTMNPDPDSQTPSEEPILEDRFESDLSTEEDEPPRWSEKANVDVVEDPTEPGNRVAQFYFEGGDPEEDAWAELRFSLGDLYQEIWIKYRLYIPENYYHRDSPSSDNNKGYIMAWSGTYNDGSNVLVSTSWWHDESGNTVQMGNWKTNTQTSEHYEEQTYNAMAVNLTEDLGKWQEVVIRIKVADHNQANGALQVWKNGEPNISFEGIENYSKDGIRNGIEKGYVLGWSNSGFDEDTYLLVDDFVLGETEASIGASVTE